MIFLQKSLPLPNSSRTSSTISSAWWSLLAKIKVLGTISRPGNSSVNRLDFHLFSTVRIWSGAVTERSSCGPVYTRSSSSVSQRRLRVWRSMRFTALPFSTRAPWAVISVSMRNTSEPTFTPSTTARSWLYSITRFWLKKPKVCLAGVAVRPMRWASKYSSTCCHTL